MSEISLQELDAQFGELLPEREALSCFSHVSFHRCHPHHHCPPRPCPPPLDHHCPPPPPPWHPTTWLPFKPKA
jgi:hypothetical protein